MGMYSITPIGSPSAGASSVAGAYVEYLENGQPMRGLAQQNNLDGTVTYYADAIEGPAMWSGHGAARLGLFGQVEPDHLKSLLEGRHHLTGERLTTAQGSAGRYGLKVGEPTRLIDDRPVWSAHDLQHRFELDDATFTALLGQFAVQPTEHEGNQFYEIGAVAQFADSLDNQDDKSALRAGDPGDTFTTGQAAKLLGVSRRYVGKVIAQHQQLRDAGEDLGNAKVDWLPATRRGRAGRWKITRADLIDFDERREPPAVRLAYDVTFTFEKSVSILGLLSEGRVRDVVTQAIVDANNAGLAHLDQHASNGRARGETIGSEGLAAASYVHATSRRDDPFLHVHNVIANIIEDEHGIGRAIDGRNLYLEGPTAAALASAELRWQLNQHLGVGFIATGNGVEVAGISAAVRDAFSTRSAEVEDLVGNISATAGERARAAQFSRPEKGNKTINELYSTWWETSQQHGFTPDDLANLENQVDAYNPQLSPSERTELMAHLGSKDGVTSARSIFTYGDVVRAIGDWTPKGSNVVRVLPAVETGRLADDFVTSMLVVPLDVDKRHVEATAGKITSTLANADLFSTRRMLRIHNQIDSRWAQGLDGGGAVVDHDMLTATRQANPELTQDQADFVTQWVTSGHQFQSGTGVPGAGKTFTMAAATNAWEASGRRVIGAAIKGTAARELAAVGVESSTLASLFVAHDLDQHPLDANTVLIVDEASTIGDEDLHRLLGIATETGATVRFLGDTEQHQSVPAGGMWTHLVNTYAANTPTLTESHRFKDSPVDVAANQVLRDGRIKDAFQILADAGQLHEAPTKTAGYEALLRRAIATREAGNHAPMIERTNHGRKVLNDAMQQLRIDNGQVTNVQTYERHRFGVGDDVMARSKDTQLHPNNDPDAYIRNGSTGTVTAATPETLTVDFAGLGEIDIPATNLNTLNRSGGDLVQLGYALTSYAVQGSTHPLSNSAIAPGANKSEALVDISRGRTDNQLILVGNNDTEIAAFKEPTTQTLTEQVADSMSSGTQLAAGAVDSTAIDRDMNLARIYAIGEENHDHVVSVEAAQRRAIIANPPTDIVNYLPPKPTVPHLRQQWERAVVTAGLYAARHTPRPNASAPWGYTLGSQPDPTKYPERHDAWNNAVQQLAKTTVALTLRGIEQTAIPPTEAIETPLPELAHKPPTRRDTKDVRRTLRTLNRLTSSLLSEADHDRTQARTDTAVRAASIRTAELDRQRAINDTIATTLTAKPVDYLSAVEAVDRAHELISASLDSAISRQHLEHQQRKPHPSITNRLNNQIRAHQQQLELANNMVDQIHNLHVNQPNPLETQRHETIAHQTQTNPDPWLTNHIEQLAHNNQITPATSIRGLAEWAGQAAIYKERWSADPLAPKPLTNDAQTEERNTLHQLHTDALEPTVPDIDLAVSSELDMEISL